MAITANSSADGQELTIYVEGRFDFGAHQEFRDAYERIDSSPRRYVVDLKNTTYLDSSALGMLLLLRDLTLHITSPMVLWRNSTSHWQWSGITTHAMDWTMPSSCACLSWLTTRRPSVKSLKIGRRWSVTVVIR